MNQTFKQKALVAAISAAVAFGAAGVSTQALANSFSDSSIVATITAGVNVPKSATASVTSDVVLIGENITGAFLPTSASNPPLRLQLSNSAKFLSGTLPTVASVVTSTQAAGSLVFNGDTLTLATDAGATTTNTVTYIRAAGTVGTVTYTATNADTPTTQAASIVTAINTAEGAGTASSAAGVVSFAANKGLFVGVTGMNATTATVSTVTFNSLVDTSGVLTIGVLTAANTAGPNSIKLSGITLDTSASALGVVSLSNLTTPTGFTAGNTLTLATVAASGATVALNGSSVLNTTNGVAATLGGVKITETFAGDLKQTSTAVTPIKVSLSNSLSISSATVSVSSGNAALAGDTLTLATNAGATTTNTVTYIRAAGTVGTVTYTATSGDTPTTQAASIVTAINTAEGAGTASSAAGVVSFATNKGLFVGVTGMNATTAAVSTVSFNYVKDSSGSLYAGVATAATGTTPSVITVASVATSIPTTVTTGTAINATTSVYVNSATSTSTTQLAAVVAGAATVALTRTATTTPVVYAGRTGQVWTVTGDALKLTETLIGGLPANSLLSFTLNAGAFTAAPTFSAVNSGVALNAATLASSNTVANTSVSAISTGVASTAYNAITLGSVDLSKVSTTGPLTVAISGATQVAPTTVTLANIANATNASASGTAPTLIPGGSSIALPDVVITESNAGALNAGNLGLRLASGVVFDSSAVPTVTVTTASGAALTGKVTAPTASNFTTSISSGTGNLATLDLAVAAQTSTTDGPMTIRVSGLKAKALTTATGGATTILVHGTASAIGSVATGTEETTTASNVGAAPTAQSVTIATVGSSVNPTYPTATVTDQTKAVIAGLPLVAAGNDQGKPGAVYVAVVYQGNVFFLSSTGTWSQFTSAATVPAYFTGTLGTTTLDIVKTALDLTPIKGAQIVAGYGLGIAGLSSPFDDFIKNSRYNVVYTVQ